MTEKKLINLSSAEECWLIVGMMLGCMLMIVISYICTYLPTISEVEKAGLSGLVCGGAVVYLLGKIQWGDEE